MRTLALCAAMALSACVTTPAPPDPAVSLLISCKAYDASLNTLTGFKAAGKLSEAQIATVDHWRPILNAACTGSAPAGSVLDQVEAGLIEMMEIEETERAQATLAADFAGVAEIIFGSEGGEE